MASYPYNAMHRRQRQEAIDRAGGPICSKCHRLDKHVELAHLCNDPWCRDPEHQRLFCKSCHVKFDSRQAHSMRRRTLAKKHGQLWIDEEVRLAPVPVRAWPARVRQPEMFS